MTQREFQEVRDELFLDGLIFQKSDNLASRLLELDMNYPFGDSSVAMDAITSENQQLLWKEVNKVAKKLSQKLHDKVHADDNVFTVHYGFNVSGVGKGEKTKYQPFTLEFDDGQILTVLARNIKDFKNYKPNKDVIITHFMLNNKDITKGIYKNGDTDIDTALTVARLKKIIEASHRKFVANNIDDDELKIKKLEKEIDGMKLDLSDVVTEANKIINDIKENTYTINLPTGSEKYITAIREAFAKDEKLKGGINYSFTVGGTTLDAIDKKEVSIEGVEKSIITHMKKVIHFITIGADKIEDKSGVEMPSVDLIRNAEFIKEKTELDYEVDHHQYASFITAEKEFSVGEDGRGSVLYLPIGEKEGWSVKERWLSTNRPRKVIIEKINEELAKDKQREDDDMFDYDRDAVNSTDLLNKNIDIIRNFGELSLGEQKALIEADRWDMVGTAQQFVAYGEDGRASVVGIYGNVKKGTIEVRHLELKGEQKRAGDPAEKIGRYALPISSKVLGDMYPDKTYSKEDVRKMVEKEVDRIDDMKMLSVSNLIVDKAMEILEKQDAWEENKQLSTKGKLEAIKGFMSEAQYSILSQNIGSEDYEFSDVVNDLYETITNLPKLYEKDGEGDSVQVQLHYFSGGSDWYITEANSPSDAYGYAILNGDREMAELGYVNTEELTRLGVELDFYYTKQTLSEIKGGNGDEVPESNDLTDQELEARIKENEVYKQIIKDSHGGVMYNVADADKYDAREILALWDMVKHKDAMSGIIKGAMSFLHENQTKTEDDNHMIDGFLQQVAEQPDSQRFEKKLDEVAELIEEKGLMDKYEDELNRLADQLTALMKSENE